MGATQNPDGEGGEMPEKRQSKVSNK